jgi:DNA repair protein RadA/Sms
MLRFAKESNIPVVLIGHITKDGSIAGPKILEHMVDAVLQFEGDLHHTYRILRTLKNRFGSASEIGIYEMQGDGLREVNNPSEILITERENALPGVCVSAAIEGMRPLLIETQALVSTAVYGTPQRNANGYDLRRLNMLLAVLEKRCGFRLGMFDVFVNIAGGLKLDDPGIDLSIACSILSSYENVVINPKTVCIGEIGLSGEIRGVQRVQQRLSEAKKLGFKEALVSKYAVKGIKSEGLRITPVERIDEAFTFLFG